MKEITTKDFTRMLCDVLRQEEPETVMGILNKCGVKATKDTPVYDVVKKLRSL